MAPILAVLALLSISRLYCADIACEWTRIDRVVAIGDLHGDFLHCVQILQGTGLIDDKLQWIGGETHLVQLGDIMDRGPRARDIFDLMKRIEGEADKTGGRVHVLLGNHEEANLIGTALDVAGYLSWEQFVSFLPESFLKRMERKLKKVMSEADPDEGSGNAAKVKFWTDQMTANQVARSLYLENFRERYAKWLLGKNIVIRINDVIFTHGGISEEYSTWKIKDINKRARLEISAMMRGRAVPRRIVYEEDAPQWFRGLIKFDETDFEPALGRILANLDARAIVVGHTVRAGVPLEKLSRFQGRVWGIDTGISGYYRGKLSALIIQDGQFSIWREKE